MFLLSSEKFRQKWVGVSIGCRISDQPDVWIGMSRTKITCKHQQHGQALTRIVGLDLSPHRPHHNFGSLFQHRKPCPQGKIRNRRLCHMIGSMLSFFDGVVPTTTRQRSNNESIHEVITNVMVFVSTILYGYLNIGFGYQKVLSQQRFQIVFELFRNSKMLKLQS